MALLQTRSDGGKIELDGAQITPQTRGRNPRIPSFRKQSGSEIRWPILETFTLRNRTGVSQTTIATGVAAEITANFTAPFNALISKVDAMVKTESCRA